MHIKLPMYLLFIWRKTHAHKITNVPAFYMALEHKDFDQGKSITWAIVRVGP
jgi:hypothetical protein